MSRIDDTDREAQRAAEQRGLRKKDEEQRTRERHQRQSAFAKLIHASSTRNDARQRDVVAAPDLGSAAEGRAAWALPDGAKLLGQAASSPRRLGRGGLERGNAVRGRAWDARVSEARAESRRKDTDVDRNSRSEGDEVMATSASSRAAARRGKAELGTDAERGGSQSGSGSNDRDEPQAGFAPGFRLNPALMAPVPVAKPKEKSPEGLRVIATEIAQKIVERVLVGIDGAGRPEFQIELRSDVLAGLSIRISGANGKIHASFSAADRAVVKLLRETADGLKQALRKRGLTLEELRIEERP
jgi:hypothetical protein